MEPAADLSALFAQLGIALGLGLLVGLQRERSAAQIGGFRTFALVTASGTLCAYLARAFGGWVLAAGFLALAAQIAVGNLAKLRNDTARTDPARPGLTTEVAMLLMFALGAFVAVGPVPVAIALGGGVAVLLHLKPELHRLAGRIGDADFRAIMQFALISLVILPVLPDRTYGPYQVLNPHRVWLMVVLIVGLGLAGYVAYKLFGRRAGTLLAGLLGGLISSTATTVAYARRAHGDASAGPAAALVVALAGAVVFVRLGVEIAVVAPGFLAAAAVPLGVLLAALAVAALVLWRFRGDDGGEMPDHGNPSELATALGFAGIYALVVVAVAAAREHFGTSGLYTVALLSGLTDMDAITLSTAQLVRDGQLLSAVGARVIVLAAMANLAFKASITLWLGSRALFGRVAAAHGLAIAAGLAWLLLL